jgi:O-methyltransferase involved in polyketide biosynthesis
MYIAEASVRETLGVIASVAAPGSSLVMDYATQEVLQMLKSDAAVPFSRTLVAWREPWIFGIPSGEEKEFFAGTGLELVDAMEMFSQESIQRYLTRQDGSVVGLPPGMQRWTPPQGSASMGAVASAANPRWYSMAELAVLPRP